MYRAPRLRLPRRLVRAAICMTARRLVLNPLLKSPGPQTFALWRFLSPGVGVSFWAVGIQSVLIISIRKNQIEGLKSHIQIHRRMC